MVFRHLHTVREHSDREVELKLLVVWWSLQAAEQRTGRRIDEEELGRFRKHSIAKEELIFDATT